MRSDSEQNAFRDIFHHIALAQSFIGQQTYESFRDDAMRVYAVTRCLEIISEASRRLTRALKARHPEIQWREMAHPGNSHRPAYQTLAARIV